MPLKSLLQITDHPVDSVPPVQKLLPFGAQHVLVMAATPISAVFLVAKTFGLSSSLTVDLLAAAFVVSGIGSIVQSLGIWKIGVRLPFVMLQGGAPLIVFIAIAKEYDLRVASGAVFISAAVVLIVLPIFRKLLWLFPTVVLGTLIVVIGINVVGVAGKLITGQPGKPGFGALSNFALALITIVLMIIFWRVLRGPLRQLAVMFGLVGGAIISALMGEFGTIGGGSIFSLPTLFPFGTPVFNAAAAIPLIVVGVAAMAEATGQTAINAEIVGKEVVLKREVPRLIAADAIVSFIGALFGTSLLVTSGENIGLIQISGVRSRFVTATAGVILILIGLFTPVARLINAIPSPVVGGAALVVYAVITIMGINMLRRVDFSDYTNTVIASVALGAGLLPIVVPGAYALFPGAWQNLLGSGVATTAIVAVLLNIVFNHTGRRVPRSKRNRVSASPTGAGAHTPPDPEGRP